MSDCPDCAKSAERLWHAFTWTCRMCRARHVSRSPQFAASRRIGRFASGYAKLLDVARVEHDEVKQAWERDAMNRAEVPR